MMMLSMIVRTTSAGYRLHSSRNFRNVRVLSLPHNPDPDPATGNKDRCRARDSLSSAERDGLALVERIRSTTECEPSRRNGFLSLFVMGELSS
jgi:hypothetical protein